MNILFFLIPKEKTSYALDTYSLRQTIEKMENCGYSSIPLLNTKGQYIATITEGDILRYIKNNNDLSLKKSEKIPINGIIIKKEIKAINIYSSIELLLSLILEQNFVPVVDDLNAFIGIVTRKSIINYFKNNQGKLLKYENQ